MKDGGREPDSPQHGAGFISVMLEHATDGLCLVGSDGRVLDTTPAVDRILGYPRGSLCGRAGLDLVHPDDLDLALERLGQLGESIVGDIGVLRFQHFDGHYVAVELVPRENPEFVAASPDGTLILSVRDVTENQEARMELSRIRRRGEIVAEIAARFVAVVDEELDREITTALEEIGGHTGADQGLVYLLKPDLTTMVRSHSWTHPDYANRPVLRGEIGIDTFPAWRDLFVAMQPIVVGDTETIDESWIAEAAELRATGVSAVLAVPLVREGLPVGFLALGAWDRALEWSDDDLQLAQVAVDIMGSAIARRDANEASRGAEARFRALVENSSDALIVLDRDAVITREPLGQQLFGYEPQELLGMNAMELVHPDDLEFAAIEMLKAIEDPSYQATNAMRIRHRQGHWIPIELVASSHFDDPAVDGIVMNVRDHSERERVAAALRVSEARIRHLISNLPGAVFRCSAQAPYLDEYLSQRIEELTGYPPEEFLSGAVIHDNLILAEHRDRTDRELADAIDAHAPYVIEYPIRHADGSLRWLSEHGQAIYDDTGTARWLEGVIFDVTQRVDAVEESRETEMKLASLVANVPGTVFRCLPTPPYPDIFCSNAIADLTGYTEEELRYGLEYYELIVDHHKPRVDREIHNAIARREPYLVEYQITHRDGSRRWIEERGQAHYDNDDEARWIDGAMVDVTIRKELEHRLAHAAAHDPLTGLPNRARLVEHLDAALARNGVDDLVTAVLFLDLDRFKLVNDALGHGAGDELLIHFTRRLRSVLRESDFAARPGGDEFVVVCADLAERADAEAVADRIATVLRDPFSVHGRTVFVTASIGIAYSEAGASAGDLVRSADAAVYRAKDRGRNRYEIFDEDLRTATSAALEVETDLHRALEHHQLFLRYQPIVELATARLVGVEALVRWHHPTRGLLEPDQFLPAAEASGLIVPIGHEVLDLAAGVLATVPATDLPGIAINLSPQELAQPDLITRLVDTIADARHRRRTIVRRDHGARRARRPRSGGAHTAGDPQSRNPAGHRRLRHRVLLTELPAAAPGGFRQDRPKLHHRTRQPGRRRDDRCRHHRARPRPRPRRGRRRS